MMSPSYMLVIFGSMAASWFVSFMLKKKFKEFSAIQMRSGLSGKDVAERMLADAGITDVKVTAVPGQLTDHYNPGNKTVNLSEWVHDQRTVAAAAVAAHEVGHAIQHADSYAWLGMRSKLVPATQIAGKISQFAIMGGIMLMFATNIPYVLAIGVGLFAVTTLFAFVTLPVEFDASARALSWLNGAGITSGEEHKQAKSALKWAASTYVVGALASLAQLLYWASYLMNRD